MAASTRTSSIRTLVALGAILAVMFGAVAAGTRFSDASWTPGLALDLAGGTEVILTPVAQPGQEGTVAPEAIDDAVEIIRQRVDGSGISEATVGRLGEQNILVELPGDPTEQQATLELIRQSAQLTFRPVLTVAAPGPVDPATGAPLGEDGQPVETPATEAPATEAPTDAPATDAPATEAPATEAPATGTPAPEPTPEQTSGSRVPAVLAAATPAVPTAEPAPATTAAPTEGSTDAPTDLPTDLPTAPADPATGTGSDLAQITPEIADTFAALDCTDPANRAGGVQTADDAVLVTCDPEGTAKYVLGPVELSGTDISGSASAQETNQQGFTTGGWVVTLDFTNAGGQAFGDITSRISQLPQPQNQFGVVLDGLVISAPSVSGPITGGTAQISDGGSGTFTRETTEALSNQLRFGALPVSFEVQTESQISATLGVEQLERGILAGLIGLGLVVLYSLSQYRALGLVTVGSLVIAAALSYGAILLLSWTSGYRLSLPGVAGLIISIGVTADSFIVYFERVRDEVREGRSVVAAVQTGWARARRTIIIADVIQLLAAVILYVLAVGGVRGFAFTLGLTTIIDLLVVMLFTHPVMSLLARTRFFGEGHKLSGFDAEHLGATVAAYAGRGRLRGPSSGREIAPGTDDRPAPSSEGSDVVTGGPDDPSASGAPKRLTIAERRAAEARAAREAEATRTSDGGIAVDERADEPGSTPTGPTGPTTTPER